MNIIGEPSAPITRVAVNAHKLGAAPVFINDMMPALWDAALNYRIDPVAMVAQAAHETGYGNFTGKITAQFFNTAGIKVRYPKLVATLTNNPDEDQSLAHQMFPNWEIGAIAHAQHLYAYMNKTVADPLVDPRFHYVFGKHFVVTVEDLNGRWATAADYGTNILLKADKLRA